MDKLVEHAIRMLEIVEGENDFFRNDEKRQADIARAVYDTILRVQVLERKADRKTEPQTDLLVKTPHKSRDSHETAKTEPQKSCSTCGYSPQTPSCDTCEGYSNWWSLEDEPQAERSE